MSKSRFTVVIPCYNEEHAILDTLAALQKHLDEAGPHEVLVVDDGSRDGSARVLREAAKERSWLRVVVHKNNRGYGAALKTGIRQAASELIVITDADGTYPIERIPEMVALCENADMVVGARTADDVQYPFLRRIPKVFLRRYASWLSGQNIPDMNSGLRVFRKSIAEKFINILPDGFSFTTTITIALHTNYHDVRYVPISYSARIGKSKIRPIRDTINFLQLIVRTGMYFAPLRVFSPIILVLAVAFMISAGYDLFMLEDLTEKTLILLMFTMNTALFALLGDMIDKRT